MTTSLHDYFGRDSVVRSPVNGPPSTDFRYQIYLYDARDRLTTSYDVAQTSGPNSPRETLTVSNQYDDENQVTLVTRTPTPDPLGLGDIVIGSTYDAAHRKISEFDPNRIVPETRHWAYDPAGNVKTATRDGTDVTAEYDALNRVTHRVVPDATYVSPTEMKTDDQRFGYDASGHLVSAVNNNAQVGRVYTLGGNLVVDSLRIAVADPNVTDFTQHNYVIQSSYDPSGRRISMTPPTNLGVLTPVSYTYDSETGDVSTISPQGRGTFSYFYSGAGLLDSLREADGAVEKHSYDADGREMHRSEVNAALGMTIHDDAGGLDARGKRSSVVSTGLGRPGADLYSYDGLGAVTSTNGNTIESTPRDPLGNALFHSKSTSQWEEDYAYEPHSTRQHFITQRLTEDFRIDSLGQSFSAAGDLVRQIDDITGPMICPNGLGGCPPQDRRLIAHMQLDNGYDGDGHLTLSVKETSNDQSSTWPRPDVRDPNDIEYYPAFQRGVLEEYRYDALGRRVWTRAHRNAYCPGANERDSTTICISTIERTVYDGDDALVEIRQAGDDTLSAAGLESDVPQNIAPIQMFGVAGYVNGISIDHPLAMDRNFGVLKSVVLHFQWHGDVDFATTYDGHPIQCGLTGAPAPTSPCQNIAWPGASTELGTFMSTPIQLTPSWWGTAASGRQNATGMLDMRNRQYDPRTGRFTQEDPLGLAGGMNLYAYAHGDPVNYSDPFGLKDCQSTSD